MKTSFVLGMALVCSAAGVVWSADAASPPFWQPNASDCFEAPGLSLLLFHNDYPAGKQGGIELIQHDRRVISMGCLAVKNAEGQWVARAGGAVRVLRQDPDRAVIDISAADVAHSLRVWPQGQSIHIAVDLQKPLSPELAGRVALQFEFPPPDYVDKSFHLGPVHTTFPRQANGSSFTTAGSPFAIGELAHGDHLSVAPEDPSRWVTLERRDGGELVLTDERNIYHHYWFVLRAGLLPDKTTGAAEVILWANSQPGWRRPPVILCSQVGYHPAERKQAWLELDPRDPVDQPAELRLIDPRRGPQPIRKIEPANWGRFLRYHYAAVDFSDAAQPGLYQLVYRGKVSNVFRISPAVYQTDVWQPVLETFLPVQMCHMHVRDRFRVWHGACHLDDALQAPVAISHVDSYRQGNSTETPFEPLRHIPGLARGGWHDAGDFDLAAGGQASTTYWLALSRETFRLASDHTSIDWEKREVHLHRPDGVPDLVQQVRQGVENLLSGYRVAGHSFCGIVEPNVLAYAHQGDPASMTDNRVFDPALEPDQQSASTSGKRDDRWAFTSRDSALEYHVAAALAAASRVLTGHYDELAAECRRTAEQVWDAEQNHPVVVFRSEGVPRDAAVQAVAAAVELWLTTGQRHYRDFLMRQMDLVEKHPAELGWRLARALPLLDDAAVEERLRSSVRSYRTSLQAEIQANPFGLPLRFRHGGVAWEVLELGARSYFLVRAYPEVFEKDLVYRSLQYALGVHPGSNVSLVSGVGTHSLTTAFGFNRSDFSYIPGGVVLGTCLIRPDFPELKEGHSFIWQQTEYLIHGAASFLFCALAADQLGDAGANPGKEDPSGRL